MIQTIFPVCAGTKAVQLSLFILCFFITAPKLLLRESRAIYWPDMLIRPCVLFKQIGEVPLCANTLHHITRQQSVFFKKKLMHC